MNCSFCNTPLTHVFIDLNHQPPSNSFLTNLDEPEMTYPLRVFVCDQCFLVQLPEYKKATEIFNDEYIYFSSQSPANVSHAKEFADIMIERFNPKSVLEIGSNDGYMLQWFKARGCDVLGYDPAREAVEVARSKGIETVADFFGTDNTLYLIGSVDLICGVNVLAHQPDINDFVEGVRIALKPDGVAVFEFPHLMNLVDKCQFDTIYHEHYHYFSFMVIREIFVKHGLIIFDVEEIPEHGGSLRIYATHKDNVTHGFSSGVSHLYFKEQQLGMKCLHYYTGFQYKVNKIKTDLVSFLIEQKRAGKLVMGYGAPAKAATLLNYCGVKSDLLPFVVDRSPHKIGKFMPGSHIPVVDEAKIRELRPEYILVLAWNLKEEIMGQLKYVREWKCKFIVPIPTIEVI